ncbi:MAG: regulator [Nitrososphaeria archaeon]|jgi:predicted regulator of amino acid metabolism with ACT domain
MAKLVSFMKILLERYKDKPAKVKLIKKLISYGLSIKDGSIYCNDIEIPYVSIARAAEVDQRVVKSLVKEISSDPFLSNVFSKLKTTVNMISVASELGYGVIEITAKDPKEEGIVAAVSSLISSAKLSIKQVIAEDPDIYEEPKLYIITDGQIQGDLIPKIKQISFVKSITIY